MTQRTGSCLCGAVQYTLSAEPLTARICWCKDCQKIAANGTVNVVLASEAISVTGELAEFYSTADSGDEMLRRFCPKCGSHIFSNMVAKPEITIIRAGTLSDPSSITPAANIWVRSAPQWACMDGNLESVEKQPAPPQGSKP